MMVAKSLLLLLSLAACSTTRVVAPLRPDLSNPERFVCETATRPTIPPEYVIDWSRVVTVPQAKAEHESFVRSIRSREGVIVGYIVTVEGKLFTCFVNMQWQRDFYTGTSE